MLHSRLSRRTLLTAVGLTTAAGSTAATGTEAAHAARSPARSADLRGFADRRFGMFNHFNMGTFTDEEWAAPNQNPKLFAPPQVDCDQWAEAALAANMSYGVLTTKHHDGFSLWPSRYGTYNISASGYQHDIVAQYVRAFRSRGLKVGLYFSIWDRTYNVQAYDSRHGVPASEAVQPGDLTYVLGQIRELLTGYGRIDMFVTDGYAWQMGQQALPYREVQRLVKSLQPGIVMIDHGGLSQPWLGDAIYFEEPLGVTAPDGNRYAGIQGQTISNGWFWHPSTPTTEPMGKDAILDHLADLEPKWTSLILNCPPNRNGRLDDNIVARLTEVGSAWRPVKRPPLPAQPARCEHQVTPVNAYATAFHSGEGPLRAIDGLSDKGFETCWSTWSLPLPQSITVDLGGVWSSISAVEYLPKQWNRDYLTAGDVTSYTISTSVDGVTFTEAAAGTWAPNITTKIAEWPERKAAFLRLEVHKATGGYANISGLHIGGRRAEPVKVSERPLAGGTYLLAARHSGKVASTAGTDIVQGTWSDAAGQKWQLLAAGNGYYQVRNVAASTLMEVAALSRADGGKVALGPDDNVPQQHWAITPIGGGYYILVNRFSGLALNVAGASSADGADINQWTYDSTAQQQWTISPVPH
ncbi:alpha-L-fucosidase [Actinoplanes subtropicus]|uniref:alpha-L-fucosidase n=1 Tax=Actinoplanes subtropicus TaxID=543632 RepID=UPI000554E0B9|nr:alpha-L-fucosidase [Actinoplanes subtropicus]